MYLNERAKLENELLLSMKRLKEADVTLKNLKNNKLDNKKLINEIKSSIEDMKLTHNLCIEDINNYKEELRKLKNKLDEGEKRIKQLKEENENLKKIRSKKTEDKFNKKAHIINTIQLSQFLGLKSKKSKDIQKKFERGEDISEKNNNNKDFYLKKKADLEKKFQELKEKSNRFNESIEDQNKIIKDYKDILKEINQNMNNFNEGLNISVLDNANMQDNEQQKKFDEIYEQIDKVTIIMISLEDLVSNIKNNFLKNLENLLNNIDSELNLLNLEENQNDFTFNNTSQAINSEFNEIQKIFEKFWKDNDNFYEINHNVEEEVDKLKNLYKKYAEEYKKKRENSRLNLRKEEELNNNKIIEEQMNQFNYNNIANNKKEKGLGESFMFNLKKFQSKEDLYKTVNIFKETEEDFLIEQYTEEAQLLRKNYHVICYVHDDFDVYDIYYDLKAVGLRRHEFFRKCSHPFKYGKDIEVQCFAINGEEYPYIKKNHSIEFKINLGNLQSLKIHILYKSSSNKNFLTQDEINLRDIYKKEYYGLDKSLAGQKAKFSLILKGTFDIVNFSEYFLIRNKKNTKETEYMWGGIVPYEGRTTLITFSKAEAQWSFNFSIGLKSNNNLKNTMFYVPIEFIGGNNEILNIKSSCPQSTNCLLIEEERQYAIEFFHTQYKEAKFNIEGVLKNKCKGGWEVDLTDEEIDNLMPEEDRLCKEQLRTFANDIIKEFDKKNKNNDFEFHDYMKIGLWVHENITYDLSYSGKTNYSSVDIYNIRKGVCHHFTKLSNALLYSLGYKVLYAAGYVCKDDSSFKTSTGHAWSLIRLSNNKWYPFDSTWGIFSGKLPVIHIFSNFSGKHFSTQGTDRIKIDKSEMEGIFIQ